MQDTSHYHERVAQRDAGSACIVMAAVRLIVEVHETWGGTPGLRVEQWDAVSLSAIKNKTFMH